jgi:hypothetical protein
MAGPSVAAREASDGHLVTDPSLRSRVLARYPGVECLPWTDWLLLAALAVLLALTALSATASATPTRRWPAPQAGHRARPRRLGRAVQLGQSR